MEKKHIIGLLVVVILTFLAVSGWGYFVVITRLSDTAREVESLADALVEELEDDGDVPNVVSDITDYRDHADEMIRRWRRSPGLSDKGFSDTIFE